MASLLNGLELAEGRKLVCALTKTEKKRFRFIVAMEYNLWKDVDIELYSSGGDEAVKVMRNSFALSTLMNFACRVLNPS